MIRGLPSVIFKLLVKKVPERILSTSSQHKRMTYTNYFIYRVVPPDDEQ